MNTRRHWIAAAMASPAAAWTDALKAQARPPVVIGVLSASTKGRGGELFHEGMAALGWRPGTQYVVEERYAQGLVERLPALAQEIAAQGPAVILAWPSTAARAAMAAAPTTPIVLVSGDPLSTGLVTNLARPGGMVTGLSNVSSDTNQKVIELLVATMPKLQRIGFLADSSGIANNTRRVRRAAGQLRVDR